MGPVRIAQVQGWAHSCLFETRTFKVGFDPRGVGRLGEGVCGDEGCGDGDVGAHSVKMGYGMCDASEKVCA